MKTRINTGFVHDTSCQVRGFTTGRCPHLRSLKKQFHSSLVGAGALVRAVTFSAQTEVPSVSSRRFFSAQDAKSMAAIGRTSTFRTWAGSQAFALSVVVVVDSIYLFTERFAVGARTLLPRTHAVLDEEKDGSNIGTRFAVPCHAGAVSSDYVAVALGQHLHC